jgi:glucosamine--fructose-6-phosphate aminotransferase (isomerizing)
VSGTVAAEIAEIPAAAQRLLDNTAAVIGAAHAVAVRRRPFAVICGRGSSGHAGVYLRYLIETRLGLVVSAAAPSVVTQYRRAPQMDGALFIVISQSGRSPDLLAATEAARSAGALAVALVNDPDSPVARAATAIVPLLAGPELSVAATKSVVASMVAAAQLVAEVAGDAELKAAITRWPERLNDALELEWPAWSDALATARAAYVAGRGYTLGPAREIALKLSEMATLPALGFSSAELRHGPRAAVTSDTPVLLLRQRDPTGAATDELAADLAASGVPLAICGGAGATVAWPGDDHPATDAVTMLAPAYRAILAAARLRGIDANRPPFLSKVTKTL